MRRPGNIIVITDTDWSLWPSHPLLLIAGIMTISNNLFLVTRGHEGQGLADILNHHAQRFIIILLTKSHKEEEMEQIHFLAMP